MTKKLKIVAWIVALAVSLTFAWQTQAHERSNWYAGERNSHIVVNHHGKVIYTGGRHTAPVIVIPRSHRHYARVTHPAKMRKIRRMRRLFARQRIERPVIIITREIYR